MQSNDRMGWQPSVLRVMETATHVVCVRLIHVAGRPASGEQLPGLVRAVSQQPGVERAEPRRQGGRLALIRYRPARTSPPAILAALRQAGYGVVLVGC